MAIFRFYCVNAKNNEPTKVEIFLDSKSRGFTPDSRDKYLDVELGSSGEFEWYAIKFGKKFDSGKSNGGKIKVIYCPS